MSLSPQERRVVHLSTPTGPEEEGNKVKREDVQVDLIRKHHIGGPSRDVHDGGEVVDGLACQW
jgi:hypothetical protein